MFAYQVTRGVPIYRMAVSTGQDDRDYGLWSCLRPPCRPAAIMV